MSKRIDSDSAKSSRGQAGAGAAAAGKKQVRIGMVGYKFMGKVHSHAYRDVPFYFDPGAVPVMQAIAGRDEAGVRAAAEKMGWASWETDWRRLLERDDIDAIDIGTPNNLHAEIAIAAAQAGKHVICEKPLALSVEQAQLMLHEAQKANIVHMVCHNYRFAPAVQLAKRLIKEGKLGQIYHVRAVYLQDWLIDPLTPLSWRGRKSISGSGAHGDLSSHLIDLARFLVGEIAEVTGVMETFINKRPFSAEFADASAATDDNSFGRVDVDDTTAFLARFHCGAIGTFEATRFSIGNRNANRIEINGSLGSLRWDLEHMNYLHLYTDEDGNASETQGFRTISCTEPGHPYAAAYWPPGHIIGYEHTFINLMAEFMRGIAGEGKPLPDFAEGLRNQMVLEAVEQAANSRRWVTVE